VTLSCEPVGKLSHNSRIKPKKNRQPTGLPRGTRRKTGSPPQPHEAHQSNKLVVGRMDGQWQGPLWRNDKSSNYHQCRSRTRIQVLCQYKSPIVFCFLWRFFTDPWAGPFYNSSVHELDPSTTVVDGAYYAYKYTTNQLDLITFILVWKLTMLINMCSRKIVPIYL
jgi:hypothetical protein